MFYDDKSPVVCFVPDGTHPLNVTVSLNDSFIYDGPLSTIDNIREVKFTPGPEDHMANVTCSVENEATAVPVVTSAQLYEISKIILANMSHAFFQQLPPCAFYIRITSILCISKMRLTIDHGA